MSAPTPAKIPVVDFSPCALTKEMNLDDEAVKKTVDELVKALEDHGCLYIVNHGMKTDDLKELRSKARDFFNLPKETKLKCVRRAEDPKHGWVAEEMEYFSDNLKYAGDLKECFSINLLNMDDFPWPDDDVLPGFKDVHRKFMEKLNKLAIRLFKLLGIKLCPQDPEIISRAHENFGIDKENTTCLRNLYYPPMSHYADRELSKEQLRLSPHSDFGTFTFVLQDQVGGLEVQSHDGDWFEAVPLEGGIMIQAADLLERWTSGRIKALVHRVNIPTDPRRRNLPRESCVYFVTPNSDFVIRCLDGSDKYPPITCQDYIVMRVSQVQGNDDENKELIETKVQ